MDQLALLVLLHAKPGKEKEVESFLKSALPLVRQETGTTTWYALKIGASRYGIFDTFAEEQGRSLHLNGEIAKALFAKAEALFTVAPQVEKVEILAAKTQAPEL